MQKKEMINILEALAKKGDNETVEELDLNDRTISALYEALYELNSSDTNSKTSKKSTDLISEKISQLDEDDKELFEILREFRNNYSRENGYRAYTLGSNQALINMVNHKPTKENFLEIEGVGEFINNNFSDAYTSLIKKFQEKNLNSSNESKPDFIETQDNKNAHENLKKKDDSLDTNPCFDCGCEIPQARLTSVEDAIIQSLIHI